MGSYPTSAPSLSDAAATLSSPTDAMLEEFVTAIDEGQTVALVVTKDPASATVHCFHDARCAFEAHERLRGLGNSPVVAYVYPGDGIHCAAARLRSPSPLAFRSIPWLAQFVALAGCPDLAPTLSRGR